MLNLTHCNSRCGVNIRYRRKWETDFYTPPVLGGAALLPFSAPAVYKNRVLRAQDFYTPLVLKTAKGQHLPALEVYKNQSPRKGVLGKGVGNSKNASEIRQKCVKIIGKRGTFQDASKMCGTPLGENTFWTIPKHIQEFASPRALAPILKQLVDLLVCGVQ